MTYDINNKATTVQQILQNIELLRFEFNLREFLESFYVKFKNGKKCKKKIQQVQQPCFTYLWKFLA